MCLWRCLDLDGDWVPAEYQVEVSVGQILVYRGSADPLGVQGFAIESDGDVATNGQKLDVNKRRWFVRCILRRKD